MKRIIFLTYLGSILLALPAYSAPNKHAARPARKAAPAHFAQPRGGSQAMRRATPVRTSRTSQVARTHAMRAATTNPRAYQHTRNRVPNSRVTSNRSEAINRANAVPTNRASIERATNASVANNPRVNPVNNRGANINRAAVTPNRSETHVSLTIGETLALADKTTPRFATIVGNRTIAVGGTTITRELFW